MPRLAKTALPKYRPHATGQATVYLAGRTHYLGKFNTPESWEKYHRLVARWQKDGRPTRPPEAPPPPPSDGEPITLIEIFALHKQFAAQHYTRNGKPTGAAENFKATYRLFGSLHGRQPAVSLGPKAVKEIVERLISEGRSRRFIAERVLQIRQIAKWAVSEELVGVEFHQRLLTVAIPRKGSGKARETPGVLPVADEVVEATLPHLPPVVADMVKLQRLTGARPGEICQLRPADVDRSGEVWKFTPMEHKTEHHGKARVILLGPRAQKIVAPYLDRDPMAFCFSPRDSERKRRAAMHKARRTPIGYGNRPGTNRKRRKRRSPADRYTTASYRRAIARGCEAAFVMPQELRTPRGEAAKAETPKQREQRIEAAKKWRAARVWHPNQLRHTRATELRREFGIEAARVALGHSQLSVTEIYAERDGELLAKIAAATG